MGFGVVICLEWGAACLHMVQLMHPKTPNPENPHGFYLYGTQVVLVKRPLNRCSSSSSFNLLTSCCNADSKRLHCCCHLPSNFGLHRIFSHFTVGWEMPPKLPLPIRISGLPPNKWFFGSTRVHTPNDICMCSASFSTANRHRLRYVCSIRPHPCTGCV